MTEVQKADAAKERRRLSLERAIATLQRHQDARIFGVVSFHLQAGRIVRAELRTSEKISA